MYFLFWYVDIKDKKEKKILSHVIAVSFYQSKQLFFKVWQKDQNNFWHYPKYFGHNQNIQILQKDKT